MDRAHFVSLGRPHLSVFVWKRRFSSLAYRPQISRKNGHRNSSFQKTLSRVAVIENAGLSFSRAKTEVFEYDEPPQDQLSWISAGYSSAQIFC